MASSSTTLLRMTKLNVQTRSTTSSISPKMTLQSLAPTTDAALLVVPLDLQLDISGQTVMSVSLELTSAEDDGLGFHKRDKLSVNIIIN